MYSRLLVPMDGSAVAAQALPYAQIIAQGLGIGITLVRVVPSLEAMIRAEAVHTYEGFDMSVQPSDPGYEQWEERHQQIRDEAADELTASSGGLQAAGLTVETIVREGEPASAIVEEARQPGTLIAMTTHGRSGIGRWLMGSVTDKVVREAETPVLVVRAQETPPKAPRFQRIILPLDGSALAEQAIPSATALAKGLDVPVTALRSISLTAYGYGFADYSVPEYSMGSFAETVRKDVKDYMDHTADRLRQQGVMAVEISAPDGQPADAILAEAESAPGSLIVMTTHGYSGLHRWVLGSVTDRMVRHAPGPVLIVRAKEA